MNPTLYITGYSQIIPGQVRLNGEVIFHKESQEAGSFLKASYRGLQYSYPKFFKMDNLCKLAFLSAEPLLSARKDLDRYHPKEIGIFLQNSSSSLTTDEKHQESIASRENYFPSPSVFVYTLPNIMAGEIAIRHGFKGENSVQIVPGPDPDLLLQTVSESFSNERIQCCIAGWIEEYHEKLTSCLFIVEKSMPINSSDEKMESIIFDPLNIERLFKEVL